MLRLAARLLSPLGLLTACGPQDPPREPTPSALPSAALGRAVPEPGASASPSASDASSTSIASTVSASASSFAPIPNARIGDTTCETDADCAITATRACCDCCPSEPSVTSRAWLSWRDSTECKQLRCEPCSNAPCAAVEPPSAFIAACANKRCTLLRKR